MSKLKEFRHEPARVLLLMSGSIACEKAAGMIAAWSGAGHRVRVACTRSAGHFISTAGLLELGAEAVFDNLFDAGREMEHIALGQWADIIIAAPATSNLINKLALGIADDLVSTLWQAAYGLGKPMVIAPAMNTRMWHYPATRESVARLSSWGVHVLPVGSGQLACGEQGEGRLLEPEEILDRVNQLLAFRLGCEGKRVLVTGGGTREPIDTVRYIGNRSSGMTASVLANELTEAGHRVTWLGAVDALRPERVMEMKFFSSFSELESQLRKLLSGNAYDLVIHAAAVSDFSVASIEQEDGAALPADGGKLSSASNLVLKLKRNPKLLENLKAWSVNPGLEVIGFKLTDTADPAKRLAAIRRQLAHPGVDAVVHNDLSEISGTGHTFRLHRRGMPAHECNSKKELAATIRNWLGDAA
jgi:phosphopantothenoylcysteine decarboxylase/phosphopantothenate--cysteine ligase